MFEVKERFPDEEACVTFLRGLRWPQGFACPRCGGRGSSALAPGRTLWRKSLAAATVENRGERAGSLRLAVVPASQAEPGPFLRGGLDQARATVRTDGWCGYSDLKAHGATHRPLVPGDPARAAKLLPWSHTVFGNLKRWLHGTFDGASREHLPRYLQEFIYRFNRRWREHDLFFYVLAAPCRVSRSPIPDRSLSQRDRQI